MFYADDVRKGYIGCYGDGDGPYESQTFSGGNRALPASLFGDRVTHEQCAQAAARIGYEVFALQVSGQCFMGSLSDVAQMKRKLDDARCSAIPCVGGAGCVEWTNKVYSIGACSAYPTYPTRLL
jgi:hypothetical protein